MHCAFSCRHNWSALQRPNSRSKRIKSELLDYMHKNYYSNNPIIMYEACEVPLIKTCYWLPMRREFKYFFWLRSCTELWVSFGENWRDWLISNLNCKKSRICVLSWGFDLICGIWWATVGTLQILLLLLRKWQFKQNENSYVSVETRKTQCTFVRH